jgi:hypothetical protein
MVAACSSDPVTGPSASSPAQPITPAFRVAIVFHPHAEGSGTLVLTRGAQTSSQLTAEVTVDALDPGTTFQVQTAVDGIFDNACSGGTWASLGGITTGSDGHAVAALPQVAAALAAGTAVEAIFRVVDPAGHVVLKSDCWQIRVPE